MLKVYDNVQLQQSASQVTNYPARPADCVQYNAGQILDKLLVIGDKPGGIEPGALAVFLDDIHLMGYPHFMNMTPEEIVADIRRNPQLAEEIALRLYQDFRNPQPEREPPVLLIKQDYLDARKPAPPVERIRQTNAVST